MGLYLPVGIASCVRVEVILVRAGRPHLAGRGALLCRAVTAVRSPGGTPGCPPCPRGDIPRSIPEHPGAAGAAGTGTRGSHPRRWPARRAGRRWRLCWRRCWRGRAGRRRSRRRQRRCQVCRESTRRCRRLLAAGRCSGWGGAQREPPTLCPPTCDPDVPHQHGLGDLGPHGESRGPPVEHVVAAAQLHLGGSGGIPVMGRGWNPQGVTAPTPVCLYQPSPLCPQRASPCAGVTRDL